MPNAGYPDNDGSRDCQGDHDLGRQRNTLYEDRSYFLRPAIVSEMPDGDRLNSQTDSMGDTFAAKPRYPVDGDANTTPGRALAAYPSYTSNA